MEANWGNFYPLYYLLVKRGENIESSTTVYKHTHFMPTYVSIFAGIRYR